VRPDYLIAQMDTMWALKARVQNFWGITEEHNYNTTCACQSEDERQSFLRRCWLDGRAK
jgi:hypothetical protein